MNITRRVSALTAAAAATVLLVGTGGAVAGSLVTSAQIKDNTVRSRDVRDGTLSVLDLDSAARRAIAAAGPAGPAGEAGPAGAPGTDGAQGAIGPAGQTGSPGQQGLIGPMGLPGPSGAPGVEGATGPAGSTGSPGPTGPQGSVGPTGPAGPSGTPGLEGAPGQAGLAGTDGTTVLNGTGAPVATVGTAGDFYLDTTTTTLYGPKTTTWPADGVSLQAPQSSQVRVVQASLSRCVFLNAPPSGVSIFRSTFTPSGTCSFRFVVPAGAELPAIVTGDGTTLDEYYVASSGPTTQNVSMAVGGQNPISFVIGPY